MNNKEDNPDEDDWIWKIPQDKKFKRVETWILFILFSELGFSPPQYYCFHIIVYYTQSFS